MRIIEGDGSVNLYRNVNGEELFWRTVKGTSDQLKAAASIAQPRAGIDAKRKGACDA